MDKNLENFEVCRENSKYLDRREFINKKGIIERIDPGTQKLKEVFNKIQNLSEESFRELIEEADSEYKKNREK